MGWLFMSRAGMGGHLTAKAYLDAQLTYERTGEDGIATGLRVLASSCLRNRVYYAAAEPYGGADTAVFAVVCLVRWNPRDREGYIFGYKDMTEHAGPCEAECPTRILDLLGPTDSEYALAWRQRCRDNADRSRRLADGVRIRLPEAVTFTDGHIGDEFIVERRGRAMTLRDPATGRPYRISHLASRAWTVVAETRVHPTIFAA